MISDLPLAERARRLLRQAGHETSGLALEPVQSGRNNRGFRVRAAGRAFFLKSYFRHPADPRERARTEWAFSSFAWSAGVRCIAAPVAEALEHDLALFEWIEGRRLGAAEVDGGRVEEAIAFLGALDEGRTAAGHLPNASEACFSITAHLDNADGRVARLAAVETDDALSGRFTTFVGERLRPTWQRTRELAERQAARLGLDPATPLETAQRCLSPSDFGFHNALLGADGRLRFVDFEYAGWDDPAKLVCDFLCQPEVPVPPALQAGFARAVIGRTPDPGLHAARAWILLPVYRVKWACTLLNEFLPAHRERRSFADPGALDRRSEQLAKAEAMLSTLPPDPGGCP